uniref:Acyl_transf_3 domain-containing protein n=1 Tax=Heterorhabditis bacteriophora TaxID=37862 RepID=A0A1I7X096_HETBA
MATSSKREDLQGLRGIAIISVLLFHFFPKQFPNGYIGVDQFFVLSGYLISLITRGEKNFTIKFVLNFYYRRVKRIVPMYLLIILAILVSLFTIFPSSNIELNVEAAGPALLFATNIAESNNAREYYAMKYTKGRDFERMHLWNKYSYGSVEECGYEGLTE